MDLTLPLGVLVGLAAAWLLFVALCGCSARATSASANWCGSFQTSPGCAVMFWLTAVLP